MNTILSNAGKATRLGAMFPAAGVYVYEGASEGNWYKIIGGAILAAIAYVWSLAHDESLKQ